MCCHIAQRSYRARRATTTRYRSVHVDVHVALSADSACRAQWLQLLVVRMGDGLNLKRIPRCDVVQVKNGQPSYLMSAEEEVAAAAELGQLVCGSAGVRQRGASHVCTAIEAPGPVVGDVQSPESGDLEVHCAAVAVC